MNKCICGRIFDSGISLQWHEQHCKEYQKFKQQKLLDEKIIKESK